MRAPDYLGGGLVNLVAELERRLSGESAWTPLHERLAGAIPSASSYVLVIFDGLGDGQLDHPNAARLARDRVGALDTAFSSQTTVGMATIATGLPPSRHGLLAYLLRMPELDAVVNTIWWFDAAGTPVAAEYESVLPGPTVAQRLAGHGVESVVVLPGGYIGSVLTRVLFGDVGAVTVRPYATEEEAVEVTAEAVAESGRMVLLYVPHVDAAAHGAGQRSPVYAEMVGTAADMWHRLADRLTAGTVAVGTADHGHVDVAPDRSVEVVPPAGVTLYGDNRCVYLAGDPAAGPRLAASLPARWLDRHALRGWWGPEPVADGYAGRLPDGVLLADDGHALLFPGADTRLVGYHGGVTPAELRIPLLVAG